MRRYIQLIILLTIIILSAQPIEAHDLWLQKEGDAYTLLYGHIESETHEHGITEYKPAILKIKGFDSRGTEVKPTVNDEYPLTIQQDIEGVIYVLTSSGYWTKTPYGTKNIPKNEASLPVYSWLSYESVKRIDLWTKALIQPLTDDLEITPLEDPTKLKKGQKTHLLVTFKGEPVEGVVVSYFEKPRGTTNKKGQVNIRLKESGLQLISASYKQKLQSDKADEIIYTTSINFEVN